MKTIFLELILLVMAFEPAYAAKWSNQFVEFELPAQWQCSLEGSEWVCQSLDANKKKDAIIIIAAKLKGPQDSLEAFTDYLKKPKEFKSKEGKSIKSEWKYTKNTDLNSQTWVDSLHFESEVPSFFTRYLATTVQDIAILVTYSINKAKYALYLNDFEAMVKTMKAFRKPGGINAGSQSNIFAATKIPSGISDSAVFGNANPVVKTDDKKTSDDGTSTLYLIGGGALVVFWWIRKKKKNQE